MSIPVSVDHLQGKERKEILNRVQQQAKQAALEAIQPVVTGFLEAEVEIKLGRKKGANRCISTQKREIDWKCGYCGCQDAHQFTRDGHYKRNLETGWGHMQGVQVPMIECQNCHHDVVCIFSILEKHKRFWLDLDQDVLFSSGVGQSLRTIRERWSEQVGGNVGLRTINERINQVEPLIQQMRATPFLTAPTVVQFDGIWVTMQRQEEQIKQDTRKRKRKQRTGKKIVILVALGFWEDGRREILDWQVACSEEHTQWEILLNRLWERKIQPEKGLQMIVRDGCGG
jgi:hypothetical protein